MGQKVHPITFRLGNGIQSSSVWHYRDKNNYADMIEKDFLIRDFFYRKMKEIGIGEVRIERTNICRVTVRCSRPGIAIGKKGQGAEWIKGEILKIIGCENKYLTFKIEEIKKPDLNAYLVAQSIAQRLERRGMFRKVMKQHIASVMKSGASGVKVSCSGRLGGAEIARNEWSAEGQIKLHTIRSNIDYAEMQAHTTYGIIGVKVWIAIDEKKHRSDQKKRIEV